MGVVGVHNWQLAHFSKQAQEEVWGENPTVLLSSSYAPTGTVKEVEGGCLVSGRWFYSSGVDHADWVLLGGNIPTDAPFPDYRTYLIPRKDFEIIEDWDVMGLRGTGSKSVQVKDAFVPLHRQLPIIASQTFGTPGLAEGTANNPLFLVPFPTIFGACITTPALGAAQGMLDIFVENTTKATSFIPAPAGRKSSRPRSASPRPTPFFAPHACRWRRITTRSSKICRKARRSICTSAPATVSTIAIWSNSRIRPPISSLSPPAPGRSS